MLSSLKLAALAGRGLIHDGISEIVCKNSLAGETIKTIDGERIHQASWKEYRGNQEFYLTTHWKTPPITINSQVGVMAQSVGLVKKGSSPILSATVFSHRGSELDRNFYRGVYTGTHTFEDVFWIGLRHPDNYYHWITECLLRLCLAEPFIRSTGLRVLVAGSGLSFQVETLKVLFPKLDISFLSNGKIASIKKIFYIPQYEVSGRPSQWALEILKERMSANISERPDSMTASRIIAVRGSKTKKRKWKAERQIIDALVPLGFETVDFGQKNFKEQILLIQKSTILLGPHGAALTNILWGSAKLFEFSASHYPNDCFIRLCGMSQAHRIVSRSNLGFGAAKSERYGGAFPIPYSEQEVTKHIEIVTRLLAEI